MSKTPTPNPQSDITDTDLEMLEDVADTFDDEFGEVARRMLQSLDDEDEEVSRS